MTMGAKAKRRCRILLSRNSEVTKIPEACERKLGERELRAMATLAQISASVGRHIFLQNVARGLAGDTGSPRSHRLIEPFAVPPFRVIPGQVKRQRFCQNGLHT